MGGGGIGEAVALGEGVATGGKAVPVPEHADAMSAVRARRIEARAVQADAALGLPRGDWAYTQRASPKWPLHLSSVQG